MLNAFALLLLLLFFSLDHTVYYISHNIKQNMIDLLYMAFIREVIIQTCHNLRSNCLVHIQTRYLNVKVTSMFHN